MFDLDQRARIQDAKQVSILSLVSLDNLRKQGHEWSGPCPFCGKGDDRFFVAPRRNAWGCRYCAPQYNDPITFVRRRDNLSFWEAVELLSGPEAASSPTPTVTVTRHEPAAPDWQPPWWAARGIVGLSPRRFAAWQAYKPLTRQTIVDRQLGLGVVPGQRLCRHERLLVPVVEGSQLVAYRGRATCCACPKWLTAAGSKKTLYGLERLAGQRPLWITENHADALMLEERYGFATLSPTTGAATRWLPAWIEAVARAAPAQVVIAFDNDEAGERAGLRLEVQLCEAGVRARLWQWRDAPPKADIGWLIEQMGRAA